MKHYTNTLELATEVLDTMTRDELRAGGCRRCGHPFLVPADREPTTLCSPCAYFALEELAVAVLDRRIKLPLTGLA